MINRLCMFKHKFARTLCTFKQKFVRTLCTFKHFLCCLLNTSLVNFNPNVFLPRMISVSYVEIQESCCSFLSSSLVKWKWKAVCETSDREQQLWRAVNDRDGWSAVLRPLCRLNKLKTFQECKTTIGASLSGPLLFCTDSFRGVREHGQWP